MINLFTDIISLVKSLRWVDFIFMMLVILLLVTIITIIYLIKLSKSEIDLEEDFSLEKLSKEIEEEHELPLLKPSSFEKAQEEHAIISYDELLANTGEYQLEYDEEYANDLELEVRKIKKAVPVEEKSLYRKEEEYLKSLLELKDKLS